VTPGEDKTDTYAFAAVFDQGKFKRFQRMPLKRFEKEWLPETVELPDWRGTAQAANELHLQKRRGRRSQPPVA
jgi:hypothetical protein